MNLVYQEYTTPKTDPVYTPPDYVFKSFYSVHLACLAGKIEHMIDINDPYGDFSDRQFAKCSIFTDEKFDEYTNIIYISENCLVTPGSYSVQMLSNHTDNKKFICCSFRDLKIPSKGILNDREVICTEFFILPQSVREKLKETMKTWDGSNEDFDTFLTSVLIEKKIQVNLTSAVKDHKTHKEDYGLNNYLDPWWYAEIQRGTTPDQSKDLVPNFRPKISYYPLTGNSKGFQVLDYNKIYS